MADPFGTGAGIVGVIGLAIQITQVVVQFRMEWKDAPDNVKAFMAELRTLKTVLSETNTNILLNPDFAAAFQTRPSSVLSQLGPNAPPTTDTNRMLEICQRELESLLSELKKQGQGHRIGWERLKGAFLAKRTRDSVENLCRQCQALNNMLSIDAAVLGATTYTEVKETRKEIQEWHQRETNTSTKIKSGIDRSIQWQENQKCQAILNWLTPSDYISQQHDFISRRQAGTGQWILDSTEFQTWLNVEKQTLFCPGIPGAGKTIITSIVIDKFTTYFHDDRSTGIAYIYCNYRRQEEQKIDDILASLLKQLTERLPSFPSSVKDIYDRHKIARTRPSLDEISRSLQSVVSMYSKVFIIIDALDECQISNGCRTKLLSELFSLQAKCRTNLFATSRFLPEITKSFERNISLEIRASEHDVRRYLDGHILQLPFFVQRSSDLQEEVKTEIVKAVDGMFLLAQLHLDSLIGKRSPKAIRAALQKLPSGSDAYNQAYEDAMVRIEGQVASQEELAKQVLSWITCAKRPLTISELQCALAVEVGEPELDNDNLSEIEDLITVCAGLVTVDEESSIIRLVHYTTQEYFQRTQSTWFPDAENNITTICVTYLSFDTFGSGFCQSDSEFEERLQSNQLYRYAAQNWGNHAREVLTYHETLTQTVLDFLDSEPKVGASSQGLLAVKYYSSQSDYSQEIARQITGLLLAAYFGIEAVVRLLLEKGTEVNLRDSYSQTPLLWAARNGHEATVQLLLNKGAEVDSRDDRGQTPLLLAVENGYEATVQLLLNKGAEVDSRDDEGQTSLSWAAKNGHEATVQLLLNKGAKVDSRDNRGQTSLWLAAWNGHEAVEQLLLQRGAIPVEDIYGLVDLFALL